MGTTADDDTDIQQQSPRMAPQPMGADEVRDRRPSTCRRGPVTATGSRCDIRKHSRGDTLAARGFDFRKYDQAERTGIQGLPGELQEAEDGQVAGAGAQSTDR